MSAMRRGFVRRRPLLRTAAIGGGAYLAGRATANRSAQRAGQEAVQDDRISDLEQAQQPQSVPQVPQQASAPAPPPPSLADQLAELASMHDSGALTDDEFTAAKARLLG